MLMRSLRIAGPSLLSGCHSKQRSKKSAGRPETRPCSNLRLNLAETPANANKASSGNVNFLQLKPLTKVSSSCCEERQLAEIRGDAMLCCRCTIVPWLTRHSGELDSSFHLELRYGRPNELTRATDTRGDETKCLIETSRHAQPKVRVSNHPRLAWSLAELDV